MTAQTTRTEAKATFHIDLVPGEALMPTTGRFDFSKTWSGDLTGASAGVMLSAGDATSGNAGYVALELFEGTLGTSQGTFALQQYGVANGDDTKLDYAIVPGSGTEDLAGITGVVDLQVIDGVHHVRLVYSL